MKRIASFAAVLLACAAMTCKKDAGEFGLKIQNFVGDVTVVTENSRKAPEIGDILLKGSKIVTGASSLADILVSSKGIVRISENTTIKITAAIDAQSNDTQLDMNEGKVFVTLAKLSKGSFRVKTPTIMASVRGTSFRVTAESEKSGLDVLSGSVKINPVKDTQVIEKVEKIVETNEVATVEADTLDKVIAGKKEIAVRELKKEEIREIKDEIKDLKPEILEKLPESVREQLKEEIKETTEKEDLKADEENKKKKEEEEKQKQKLEKEKGAAAIRGEARKRQERERAEKALMEKERKEKEKRDRASNIPTL